MILYQQTDLLVDVPSLLSPPNNWVRGTPPVDSWLAVDCEDAPVINGRQLLREERGFHGELVIIPGETGHLTGSEVAN